MARLLVLALVGPIPTLLVAQEVRDRDAGAANANARVAPSANVVGRSFGAKGSNQPTGVVITAVVPGSPAQIAGIEVRDTIVTVNGYQVGLVNGVTYDLEREVMSRAERGQAVTLLVKDWRSGNLTNLAVNFAPVGGAVVDPGVSTQLAQVRVWYDQYLQRPPSDSELTAWRESLVRGGLTLQEIRAYLLGSTEFYDRFGRNNDVAFIYALFEQVFSRQPSPSELSRAIADLNRYGSNRVGFVKEFLGGRPEPVPPAPQGVSTKEVSSALNRYQKQMTPFVTWGQYLEQSGVIFKANASLKLIEQYEIPGRENRREQQKLADEVVKNSNRLTQLAGQIRDRAERTNTLVREARKLSEDADSVRSAADQLARQVVRPR